MHLASSVGENVHIWLRYIPVMAIRAAIATREIFLCYQLQQRSNI